MATTALLPLVQGQYFLRGYRRRIDGVAQSMTGWSWAAQVRKAEKTDAELLLDLTAYLAIDPEDDTILMLDISADVTRLLPRFSDSAAWDIFVWPTGHTERAELLVEGSATLNRATTSVPTTGGTP